MTGWSWTCRSPIAEGRVNHDRASRPGGLIDSPLGVPRCLEIDLAVVAAISNKTPATFCFCSHTRAGSMNRAALDEASQDEEAALRALEAVVWNGHPRCPHYRETVRLGRITTRKGLWRCRQCRRDFSVKSGTVLTRQRLGLHKWWRAVDLKCSGMGRVIDFHEQIGIALSAAWRLRSQLDKADPVIRRMRRACREAGPTKATRPTKAELSAARLAELSAALGLPSEDATPAKRRARRWSKPSAGKRARRLRI